MRARGMGGGTLRESPEFSFMGCERKGQWDRLSRLRPADGLHATSHDASKGDSLWDAAGRDMSTHSRVIGAHAHAHECAHMAAPRSRPCGVASPQPAERGWTCEWPGALCPQWAFPPGGHRGGPGWRGLCPGLCLGRAAGRASRARVGAGPGHGWSCPLPHLPSPPPILSPEPCFRAHLGACGTC